MSAEIVQVMGQVQPYLSAALAGYGGSLLARAESGAVNATADVGRRILRLVWHRRDAAGRAALDQAVREAAADPGDEDAAAALRQQIKRALREDADLLREVGALLPAPAVHAPRITASGTRSIAAQAIGIAVSGDGNTIERNTIDTGIAPQDSEPR